MSRIATTTGREYHSSLRAEQAEETRARILDATVRVMAAGVATLSVPAVAREAGVSVPTVYRHFRTKADLLAAVYPHLARRAAIGEIPQPTTPEEFHQMVVTIWERLESAGEEARLAMASPAAEEARRLQMPGRLAMSRRFAAAVAPGASPADRERIARVMLVLVTSASMRAWRDHLGASVAEAADDVDWVLRSLIAAATTRKDR
jgi:AcrR family transcriptional regulator